MCMTQKFWLSLCDAIGRNDLAGEPRFIDPGTRARNRAEMTDELDAESFRTQPTGQLARQGCRGSAAGGAGQTISRAGTGRRFRARKTGMVSSSSPSAQRGALRVLASPLRFDGARPAQRAASALGADNEDLLDETAMKPRRS